MQASTSAMNSGVGDLNTIEELALQPSKSTTMRPPYSISMAVRLSGVQRELPLAGKGHHYLVDIVEVY